MLSKANESRAIVSEYVNPITPIVSPVDCAVELSNKKLFVLKLANKSSNVGCSPVSSNIFAIVVTLVKFQSPIF